MKEKDNLNNLFGEVVLAIVTPMLVVYLLSLIIG
jgi:hypothetical protein